MILHSIAYIAIVLNIIAVLLLPLMIGKARSDYGYSNYIAQVLEALMVIPLALKVLGVI